MRNLGELVPVLFLFVAVIGLGAAFYLNHKRTQRQREALFAFAELNGMRFSRMDPLGTLGLPFRLFTRGDGRKLENVVWGTYQGQPFRAFDYDYYVQTSDGQGGTTRNHFRFSCAYLQLGAGWFPKLRVGPESAFTLLQDKAGMPDVQFESDAFNRAFEVIAEDRKAAYAIIDARMMDWLLQAGADLRYELVGNHLLVAVPGLPTPERYRMVHAAAVTFAQRIPDVAYQLYPAN